jgi:hypothetical protein
LDYYVLFLFIQRIPNLEFHLVTMILSIKDIF